MWHIGVLGKSLPHTLSPDISRKLMAEKGIQTAYHVMELEHPQEILSVMRICGITGMNVTIPYKEVLVPLMDEVSEAVKKIGALNTIHYHDGKFYGHNTDYIGFLKIFERNNIAWRGKRITVLGNGGAAKAIVYALCQNPDTKITAAGRSMEKLEALRARFPKIEICRYEDIAGGEIVVNTTPVGMFPHAGESPISKEQMAQFQVAADIVYNPLETEFLHLAKEAGLQAVQGLSMLVDQAVASHQIWLSDSFAQETVDEILQQLERQFR